MGRAAADYGLCHLQAALARPDAADLRTSRSTLSSSSLRRSLSTLIFTRGSLPSLSHASPKFGLLGAGNCNMLFFTVCIWAHPVGAPLL